MWTQHAHTNTRGVPLCSRANLLVAIMLLHAAATRTCSVADVSARRASPPRLRAPFLRALRGGLDADLEFAEGEDFFEPGDTISSDDVWDSAIEKDPRWNRSVRIGFSSVVESIRVIPADPGEIMGGRPHVPDHSVSEWCWADATGAGAARAAANAPVLSVPGDAPSVLRAIAACPEGGVVSVSSGMFRWDGAIKLRKGLLPPLLRDDSHSAQIMRPYTRSDGAGEERAAARIAHAPPDAGSKHAGGRVGEGGVHIRGVEGTVMMGQWFLGRYSAGSLIGVGLAGNFSVLYEAVLDVHAGPWVLEDVECRCVGGALVRLSEWGEMVHCFDTGLFQ